MSVSTDAGHFFQTSTSLAESDRRVQKATNTFGSPVKFPSKLLAIIINPFLDTSSTTAFVAEAGGIVSSFNLTSKETKRLGRPAQVPVTSLTCYGGSKSSSDTTIIHSVFAGGWDKSITHFNLGQTAKDVTQSSFKAHGDFVKCLLVAQTPDKQLVLLSGGADGELNIWTFEGHRLASLKPQSRGIESLALDPLSSPENPRIFFSTSQREIYIFTLPHSSNLLRGITISEPIIQHETSVYKLQFDGDGDLWTASADKTAKRLARENNFMADTTLVHPDFVRDIVIHDVFALAITACRDEEVRVWNTGTSQLIHIFSGHFEEVTGLVLSGNTLLSISIDATLRTWSVAPRDLNQAVEEAKNPKAVEDVPESHNDFGLTEEEEAELRALMEEEEVDTLQKTAGDEQ